MLATFVWTVFGALSFSLVSAQSVCISSPYDSLACLTSDKAASTVCASAPVQTLTITVTTTTLNPEVYSTTQHAASQVTVDVTSIEWSTVTVTTGPTSTITSMITETRTVNATITTYISPTAAARLETAAATTCHPKKAVSALESLSSDKLATACSCIGNPLKTKTVTTIITAAAVASKTTEVAGTAQTTTLYKIDISTTTKTIAPSTLVTDTTTSRTTLTTTECYALPTFTQVWGPKAGCTEIAHHKTLSLNSTVTNFYNATAECQGLCAQDSTCSFLYVQDLFTKSSNSETQYQCAFSDHAFNATTDVACDDHEKFGGFAIGYDAVDRGTEEI